LEKFKRGPEPLLGFALVEGFEGSVGFRGMSREF